MQIRKNLWTKEVENEETKTTYQYILDLKTRLEETCNFAHASLGQAQRKQKTYYDRKAKNRKLEPGDKVLLLLPTDNNKLLVQCKGPVNVIEKVRKHDYKIQIGQKNKIFHVSMLKRYIDRPDNLREIPFIDKVHTVATAVIDHDTDSKEAVTNETLLDIPNVGGTETYKDVDICKDLPEDKKKQLEQPVKESQDIFTESPGTTFLAEHKIDLISDEPIRIKQYPIPYAMRDVVKEEIAKMLKPDVIEKSDSPFSTPIVFVRKPDGSARFCLDFRATNKRTVFDAQPMSPEDTFAKL